MSLETRGPITPNEVAAEKLKNIPPEVIEVFNELIAQNYYGGYSTVKQQDVVNLLVSKGFNQNEIFKNGWLNIENIYRKAGWQVSYDKPGYNEDYEATFTFSKRRRLQ